MTSKSMRPPFESRYKQLLRKEVRDLLSFKYLTWSAIIIVAYLMLGLLNLAIGALTGVDLLTVILYPGILIFLLMCLVFAVSLIGFIVDIRQEDYKS